jgi:hypothetical protein
MADRLNIAREVAALKRMTVKELRGRYVEVFGEATRSGNKDWLWKRIAWRMQANAEGGLSERARRRAEELANDADLRLRRPPDRPAPSPAPHAAATSAPPPAAPSGSTSTSGPWCDSFRSSQMNIIRPEVSRTEIPRNPELYT